MFKKFVHDDISSSAPLKSSAARGVRTKIQDLYPAIAPILEDLIPKKAQLIAAKAPNHVTFYCVEKDILFFQERDGPIYPTLRILHKYPFIMPKLRADKGAIKHIISGSNIMCPGLTSKGATIHDEVPAGTPVALMAEGKENAIGIGLTTLSTEDIRKVNKGIGVDNIHHLGDGLWMSPPTL